MLSTVAKLFEKWNIQRIRYCHWKSSDHLQATVDGITDVDVLVDRKCADKAERLLSELGFQRLDTVILRSYPGIMDYVCLDPESSKWVHIHLHFQLALGDRWVKAFWLPLEATILSRRKFSEEFSSYVVDPHDELFLLCARMSLKHKNPFGKPVVWGELEHIRGRLEGNEQVPNYMGRVYVPLENMFREALSDNPSPKRLNALAAQVRETLKEVMRFGGLGFWARSTLRMFYRYAIEFSRRFLKNFEVGRRKLPRGGVLIAFVGIDGSGKSSGVERMERLFAQQMNVTNVFLGNGQSGASWYRKAVFRVFGTKAKWRSHKQLKETGQEDRIRVPWYYALWILICLRDKEKNLKRAIRARANGSLVLSDRWPQAEIAATFDGPRIYGKTGLGRFAQYVAKREKGFLDRAANYIPDAVLRFRVNPAVACYRKPGEFTEVVARQNAELLDQLQWAGSVVVDVDADVELVEVDSLVRAAIWGTIQGRNYV